VEAKRVLLYGESLGGAIAIDLASRRPHRALAVCCTFTSFPDLAQQKYPFFPARWLVRNQYRSIDKIRSCTGPIFIGHGTADDLVPISHGERLFAVANGPKEFVALAGLGHEPPSAQFYEKLMKFLEEVERQDATPQAAMEN
jgi:fermentation-respiration switch protein FrsA (DUF1100 family)